MDISIFIIDPSPEQTPRDAVRLARLIDVILKTEIKEIHLVSRRPAHVESNFLDKIPEKIFEKKGLFNKIKPERLQKKHIQTDNFEMVSLLNFMGKTLRKAAFIFFEDEPNELAYDGSHAILKFIKMAQERKSSILGLKRIPFSEVSKSILFKGSLVSEGEYQIHSAFKAERALQSSSNLALMNRFILKPLFFKILDQNMAINRESAFIETLDLCARSEPLFGCLPLVPVKIK